MLLNLKQKKHKSLAVLYKDHYHYLDQEQDSILKLQDRIIKLNSIGINLSVINVSNVDGVYMYHYDAAGAGAEMAQIPLSDLNKNQRADLERKISIQEQQPETDQ